MKSTALKIIAFAILLPFVAVGCADMSPTLKGGAIGAGAGAATGAAAGAILGEPGKGAGVGAVVGGAMGLILGEFYSQAQKRQAETNAQKSPSESYSTTLSQPASVKSEPLLLVGASGTYTDEDLVRNSMSLMKELLTDRGIKFEEYTVSSAAKYSNSPVVVTKSVKRLSSSVGVLGYEVVLRLVNKNMEPKDFSGSAPTLKEALSQALFGK